MFGCIEALSTCMIGLEKCVNFLAFPRSHRGSVFNGWSVMSMVCAVIDVLLLRCSVHNMRG